MVVDSSAPRVKPVATRIRAMLHRTLSANAEHEPAAATACVSSPATSRNPIVAKDARIPMRVPEATKAEFEWAAEQDGCKGVSTWLRQLGEERAEQLRAGGQPFSMEALIEAQRARNAALAQRNDARSGESALAFVPGFGLDEED